MIFEFDFHHKYGDVIVAPYEGRARIARCALDKDEWYIAGVELHGFKAGGDGAIVELSQSDPLYTKIGLWLHTDRERDIDDKWDEYVREQRADKEPV